MKGSFRSFLLAGLLTLAPLGAQQASEAWLQPGAKILANPMNLPDSFYPAEVVRYNADSGTYLIRFSSGPYAVGKGEYVLTSSKFKPAPAAAPPAQTQPPAPQTAPQPATQGGTAAPTGLQPGARVLANPLNFPNDFHPAQILSYNADSNTYKVKFTSGPYAVGTAEYNLSPSRLSAANPNAQQEQPARPTAQAGQAQKTAPLPAPAKTTKPAPANESTWERIWREREETMAAQQRQTNQPAGRVAGSTPFSGIYLRHEQSFNGTALNYREDHYYFFPDGRVYHGVPPEGPARFDWAKAQRDEPQLCGYYGVNGNEITFSWPDGSYTWVLKPSGGGYEMNYSPTAKVDQFSANARLSGTYRRGDITVAQGAPTLSTASSYTFFPDGTVSLNDMQGTDNTNLTTTVRTQDRGTYTISGNDIEIRTGAGSWRATIYPQWNGGAPNQSPARISIDGALMDRV